MDWLPGVLAVRVEAVLGGLAALVAVTGGLEPETVRFTPSETEARGRAVVEDLSAAVESGVAVEVRVGAGLVAVEDASGVRPAVVLVPVAGTLGATDWRLTGFVAGGATEVEFCLGGGMAFEAAVVGLVAGAPALTLFLRAVVAEDVLAGGAAVAFAAVGAALTAPDPNVPELMIYAWRS